MSVDCLVELEHCARCGGNHRIGFRKLTRPMEVGGEPLTHFAICPETIEPILMRMIDALPDDRAIPETTGP